MSPLTRRTETSTRVVTAHLLLLVLYCLLSLCYLEVLSILFSGEKKLVTTYKRDEKFRNRRTQIKMHPSFTPNWKKFANQTLMMKLSVMQISLTKQCSTKCSENIGTFTF
nr:uncharacterized protein LOC117688523 [Crassostrea gigas]